MTILAYGVWTQIAREWIPSIYCPKCVKIEDRYEADELLGLNGDTVKCCACRITIEDLA